MSYSVCAFNHAEWEKCQLADYSEFSECVEFFNERESGFDDLQGEWYFIPDEPLPNGDRVIYGGSHGNDHSPGASCYTHAEIYSADDLDDMDAFAKRVEQLKAFPEYLECEQDEDSEECDDDCE